MNNIMVFIEQRRSKIASVSLELVSEARKLAAHLNVDVEAAALGYEMENELEILGEYGCKRVYSFNHEKLKSARSIPYAKSICQVIREAKPQVVLFGATVIGRDIAPRVASELECGLTADCTALEIGDYTNRGEQFDNILLQHRPAFGGNILATIVSPKHTPSMATVREGVMKLQKADKPEALEVIKRDLTLDAGDFLTEIVDVLYEEKRVNLKAANIIVSAGMGAAGSSSMPLVEELAKTLGGVVGASRPVVDGGFLHRDHQVGQTGVTVRPNLYIACGISGQIQHRAGMGESKRIIAINNDPDAPIFNIAHYGIVGDIEQVIPQMIKAYHEKN